MNGCDPPADGGQVFKFELLNTFDSNVTILADSFKEESWEVNFWE